MEEAVPTPVCVGNCVVCTSLGHLHFLAAKALVFEVCFNDMFSSSPIIVSARQILILDGKAGIYHQQTVLSERTGCD